VPREQPGRAPDCTEWCPTCRADAAGLGRGPFTPEQLQHLVVEPARPAKDLEVAAAEASRDEARTVFDALDGVWRTALAAKTRAELFGGVDATERRQLHDGEAHAREARDRAWRPVVAANDRLRAATAAAQARDAAVA
jgi:hypothetical protein